MTKTILSGGAAIIAILAAAAAGYAVPAAEPLQRAMPAVGMRSPAIGCSREAFRAITGTAVAIAEATSRDGSCVVTGTVRTDGEGAGPGSARFTLTLPPHWNGKFVFLGGNGYDGFVPPAPAQMLEKGYATLSTDSGHVGKAAAFPGVDATWATAAPGRRDDVAFADYAYRARHQVNVAVRPLVPAYYGSAIARAYFVGCSNGGREAILEAQNHPSDYDGFVAGNPFIAAERMPQFVHDIRALLAAPIPFATFAAINAAVLKECDARDGVKDGLIQNPAMCDFSPRGLVRAGALTAAQGKALEAYLTGPRDTRGRAIGYANTVSGIGDIGPSLPGLAGGLTGLSAYLSDGVAPASSGFPWGPMPAGPIDWQLGVGGLGSLVYRQGEISLFDPRLARADGTLEAASVDLTRSALAPMLPVAGRMGAFMDSPARLIVYHGFDDTILNPYATMDFYRRMARAQGGMERVRGHARLFMAPNMAHCALGTGPNTLDPLTAMENWVEHGRAPDAIVAAHFPGTPGKGQPDRTMPLCAFPATARYDGRGPIMQASSWSCGTGPGDLEHSGPAGLRAGWNADS